MTGKVFEDASHLPGGPANPRRRCCPSTRPAFEQTSGGVGRPITPPATRTCPLPCRIARAVAEIIEGPRSSVTSFLNFAAFGLWAAVKTPVLERPLFQLFSTRPGAQHAVRHAHRPRVVTTVPSSAGPADNACFDRVGHGGIRGEQEAGAHRQRRRRPYDKRRREPRGQSKKTAPPAITGMLDGIKKLRAAAASWRICPGGARPPSPCPGTITPRSAPQGGPLSFPERAWPGRPDGMTTEPASFQLADQLLFGAPNANNDGDLDAFRESSVPPGPPAIHLPAFGAKLLTPKRFLPVAALTFPDHRGRLSFVEASMVAEGQNAQSRPPFEVAATRTRAGHPGPIPVCNQPGDRCRSARSVACAVFINVSSRSRNCFRVDGLRGSARQLVVGRQPWTRPATVKARARPNEGVFRGPRRLRRAGVQRTAPASSGPGPPKSNTPRLDHHPDTCWRTGRPGCRCPTLSQPTPQDHLDGLSQKHPLGVVAHPVARSRG